MSALVEVPERIAVQSTEPGLFAARLQALFQSKPPALVTTGFRNLDDALGGGLMPGGLYVLAAPTSWGKSQVAASMATRAAEAGTRTTLTTLEDNPQQVTRKIVAAFTEEPLSEVSRTDYTDPALSAKRQAIYEELHRLPLIIDDTHDVDRLCNLLARHRRQGTELAIVDQGSWLTLPHGRGQKDMFTAACLKSRRMKELARGTGLALVLVWQINRAGSKKDVKPGLHDLRDSGSVEQDADAVLIITERVPTTVEGESLLRLEIAKNRHFARNKEVRFKSYDAESRIEEYEEVPF